MDVEEGVGHGCGGGRRIFSVSLDMTVLPPSLPHSVRIGQPRVSVYLPGTMPGFTFKLSEGSWALGERGSQG